MGERISIPPRCGRGLMPQSVILSHCVPPFSIPPRSQRGVRLIDLNNNVRINTEFQFGPVLSGDFQDGYHPIVGVLFGCFQFYPAVKSEDFIALGEASESRSSGFISPRASRGLHNHSSPSSAALGSRKFPCPNFGLRPPRRFLIPQNRTLPRASS